MRIFSTILLIFLAALSIFAHNDRLRVGVHHVSSRPYYGVAGQLELFTVDVLSEVARRQGFEIVWREVANGADANNRIQSGDIDLYPVALPTAERKSRFFLSEPWWHEDLSVLVRRDGAGNLTDFKGKRVIAVSAIEADAMRSLMPGFSIGIPPAGRETIAAATSAVCSGEADAVLMMHRAVIQALADRPDNCKGIRLDVLDTTSRLGVSLMSGRDKEAIVRRVRRGIDALAEDGTLIGFAMKRPGIPFSTAAVITERIREQQTRRILWSVVIASAIGLAACCALFYRMHRYQQVLVRREKQLRSSNADLEAYAYTASHDLREPLRIVSTFTSVLERRLGSVVDPVARQAMDFVREGALRMTSMLDDLLSFTRVAEQSEPPTNVEMTSVVESVVASMRLALDESGAQVIASVLPSVRGWPGLLELVVQNLVANAIRYRKPGVAPRVVIEAKRDGSMWRFSVRDNGIGMNIAYGDKIFRLFQRLHGRSEFGGNGVGLAICKRIVERHGGRIWLAWSEIGEGSEFSFTLPANVSENPTWRFRRQ